MKNLRQLFIITSMILLASSSFAQTFGVKAGLNLSNMLMKDDEDTYSDDYKMLPGFHVGLTADFSINDMFSFEPGLLLSTKGFKAEESASDMGVTYTVKMKYNLYYLDIPLNAKAKFDVGGAKIYATFGPYIGVGLSGKSDMEYSYGGQTESEKTDIKWGTSAEDDDLKRPDFGIGFGAGAEFGAFMAGVSYQLGLANVSSYTDGGATMKNKVLGISVGYRFGGK